MKPFEIAMWISVYEMMAAIDTASKMPFAAGDEPLSDERHKQAIFIFSALRTRIDDFDLVASKATVNRILDLCKECPPITKIIDAETVDLKNRLRDEMAARRFLTLTLSETKQFDEPRIGWEEVIDRFPSTVSDIEEAGKCLALARYAAAVFHSTQVLEAGIIELGKFVGVTDYRAGWGPTSAALKRIVNTPRPERSPVHQAHSEFLLQMHERVLALQTAWRNKIDHVGGRLILMTADFVPDIAEEIVRDTRAFMRRLATEMPEVEALA